MSAKVVAVTEDSYGVDTDKSKIARLCDDLKEVLAKKDADYGGSFDKTLKEYGDLALIIRLEDKFNRLKNLTINKAEPRVDNESVRDTIRDIAGYCILAMRYYK